MTTENEENVVTQRNKGGGERDYRREIRRENGKKKVIYHRLPPKGDPTRAAELARINAMLAPDTPPEKLRAIAKPGTISALIAEFRPTLAHRKGKKGAKIAQSSIDNWNIYLKQIERDHGFKVVSDLRRSHLYKIRNDLAHLPGKANGYMSAMKGLLEFASTELDWIAYNPAQGLERVQMGESQPWPPHVVKAAMDAASPMLRLAIVTGLCSGQRISDVIRMRHDWIKVTPNGTFMFVPSSQKTATPAVIPMHAAWLDEIAKVKALAESQKIRALTLIYGQKGKPFRKPTEIQKEVRALMIQLGFVERDDAGNLLDKEGEIVTEAKGNHPATLYSFHGTSKNAICHLTELGLDETTIEAIVGKTPQTIRHYAKETKKWILAERAAGTVITGAFDRLIAGDATR